MGSSKRVWDWKVVAKPASTGTGPDGGKTEGLAASHPDGCLSDLRQDVWAFGDHGDGWIVAVLGQ